MTTKAIITGDWHFGANGNSEKHNQYLFEFIEFMVNYAKENDIKYILQLGDYYESRDKIDIRTLNYGIDAAKYIRDNHDGKFVVLSGNHDLYMRNRLDIASTNALEPYCDMVSRNRYITLGEHKCLFVPWIVDNEHWDETVKMSQEVDYMFAHLELRGFKMNENYVMEHGLSHKELKHLKRVCTGHYHKRQIKDNIVYPSNPFPVNMNDANDSERGFGVIDLDKNEVEFVNWNKVKVLSLSYEEFMECKDQLDEHTTVRVDFDEGAVEDKEVEAVQEQLESMNLGGHKIKYRGATARELMESEVNVEEVNNIDEAVLKSIENAEEVKGVDKELLLRIYKEARDYQKEGDKVQ